MACLSAITMMALACGSNSSVTTGPTQVKCQVTLSSSASTVGADGGAGSVTVAAAPECPWDASSGAPWLSGLSPAAGQGPGTVSFNASPNPAPSTRDAEIVVNDARLRVTQEAAPCVFDVQPVVLAVTAGGGRHAAAVTVLSGCTWAATTDVPWMRVAAPASGSGPGTITFDIAANDTASSRSGTLVVATHRVTVTQDGVVTNQPTPPPPPGCTFELGPSTTALGAAGGIATFSVTAGPACPWTASSTVPWIAIASGANGTGNGVVGFSVAANSGAGRSGTLVVAGQTFTVSQAAASPSCAYALASTTLSMGAAGGAGSVGVSAPGGCAWTAVSGVPWIVISAGTSGSGDGTVAFGVAANAGAARTGALTIAGQTFTVSQAAATPSCSYGVSTTTATVPASGGTGTVGVSAPAGCAWTAASNAAWISVTAGASGNGDGSVDFAVAANTGAARSGTLTIAGQTVTVSQQAVAPPPPPPPPPSCTFSLVPTSVVVDPKDDSTRGFAVVTAAGCTWTASSNDNWISIRSGASGSGSGSVVLDIAKSPGKRDRTGTVTAAGLTFTVFQKD